MIAVRGSALSLEVGDGETPEAYLILGGFYMKKMIYEKEVLDNSALSNVFAKTMLENAGMGQIFIEGKGVSTESAAETRLREVVLNHAFANFRLFLNDSSYIAGQFSIIRWVLEAEHDDMQYYSFSMVSSGAFSYVP